MNLESNAITDQCDQLMSAFLNEPITILHSARPE